MSRPDRQFKRETHVPPLRRIIPECARNTISCGPLWMDPFRPRTVRSSPATVFVWRQDRCRHCGNGSVSPMFLPPESRSHQIEIQYLCSISPSEFTNSLSRTPPFFTMDLAEPILSLLHVISTLSIPSFLHSISARRIISVAYPFLLSPGLIPTPICPPSYSRASFR